MTVDAFMNEHRETAKAHGVPAKAYFIVFHDNSFLWHSPEETRGITYPSPNIGPPDVTTVPEEKDRSCANCVSSLYASGCTDCSKCGNYGSLLRLSDERPPLSNERILTGEVLWRPYKKYLDTAGNCTINNFAPGMSVLLKEPVARFLGGARFSYVLDVGPSLLTCLTLERVIHAPPSIVDPVTITKQG